MSGEAVGPSKDPRVNGPQPDSPTTTCQQGAHRRNLSCLLALKLSPPSLEREELFKPLVPALSPKLIHWLSIKAEPAWGLLSFQSIPPAMALAGE